MRYQRSTRSPLSSQLLHIRLAGRSQDVPLEELNLGDSPTPAAIRQAVGGWLDLSPHQLQGLELDQFPNGNFILRPAAVFG